MGHHDWPQVDDPQQGDMAHTSEPHALGQVQKVADHYLMIRWFDDRGITTYDRHIVGNFGITFHRPPDTPINEHGEARGADESDL